MADSPSSGDELLTKTFWYTVVTTVLFCGSVYFFVL